MQGTYQNPYIFLVSESRGGCKEGVEVIKGMGWGDQGIFNKDQGGYCKLCTIFDFLM